MTDYLLAECVINNLFQAGIIALPAPWKKTAIGTQFYFADFFRSGTGSLLSFRISVINGNHAISTTAFVNHAHFFNISPADILEECEL
jgi:hypothetical protein